MFKKKVLLLATLVMAALSVKAQSYSFKYTADRGNGTFINPIVNGDFPDCDVIRVGDTFYFVSTTMYHFPGATLLKSKDLVNWEYCANPLAQIEYNDAYNLMNGGSHYAQGMWASSLNYYNGKFYIYFISYGRSGYDSGRNILLSATDPEGTWTMEYWPEHYYDAGWLFDVDENGKGYVYVACGIGNIYINKLNPRTFSKISSTQVVFNKDGYEGSHMYHIGDYYYLFVTTGGYWKGQTIYRSTDPMGPYEEVPYTLFQGDAVHQGALVDTPTGEWWSIMFKDAGAIGRVPYLEPVKWVDGWPRIGDQVDGKGRDVSRNGKAYKKPRISDDDAVQNADYRTYMPTNDAFSTPTLAKQWQWNHNPQATAWSLTQRPGWMRLHSCTVTDNVAKARGSLTQRIMGYNYAGTASSSVKTGWGIAKIDLSGMKEGDVAGLAVWSNPYSFIGVKVVNGQKVLYSQRCKFDSQIITVQEEKTGNAIDSDIIYLSALTNFGQNKCEFYYSVDCNHFHKFGVKMDMNYTLDFFVGQRYYLFNYSTIEAGGYIDIDWFTTEHKDLDEYFAQCDEAAKEEHEAAQWHGFDFGSEYFNLSMEVPNTMKKSSSFVNIEFADKGIAGWAYPTKWDMTESNYIVLKMYRTPGKPLWMYIYDATSRWGKKPYKYQVKSENNVIDLNNMVNEDGEKIDPSNINIVTFVSEKSQKVYFVDLYLSDDGTTPTGIDAVHSDTPASSDIYDLTGRKVTAPKQGVYVVGGRKVIF